MVNQVMFFVGLAIFIVYVYFLLRIIGRQHRIQRSTQMPMIKSIWMGWATKGVFQTKSPKTALENLAANKR